MGFFMVLSKENYVEVAIGHIASVNGDEPPLNNYLLISPRAFTLGCVNTGVLRKF
jgi:hypothetical protein